MQAIGAFVAALGLAGASKLIAPKAKAPKVIGPVTRDDARDRATLEAELRRRRGGAADMLTGPGGAEATGGGGKTVLG